MFPGHVECTGLVLVTVIAADGLHFRFGNILELHGIALDPVFLQMFQKITGFAGQAAGSRLGPFGAHDILQSVDMSSGPEIFDAEAVPLIQGLQVRILFQIIHLDRSAVGCRFHFLIFQVGSMDVRML
ncbi:hypothetical protein DSECCO2_339260 [anaerobic digester metagenome]